MNNAASHTAAPSCPYTCFFPAGTQPRPESFLFPYTASPDFRNRIFRPESCQMPPDLRKKQSAFPLPRMSVPYTGRSSCLPPSCSLTRTANPSVQREASDSLPRRAPAAPADLQDSHPHSP